MFHRLTAGGAALTLATLAACSTGTDATAPSANFTVHGSASAAPAGSAVQAATSATTGDPSSLTFGMYALYISPNDDCSAAVLVDDNGTTPQDKDFYSNPVLFSGSPAAGAYQCVAIKMSDVIRMKAAASFGHCVAGTEYAGDIYRAGESDWKDVNLNPIIGTGTDESPADDRVTIFMTRNRAATIARGLSPHQVLQLGSDLVVPGQSTFYWNGQGSVVDEGGQCGVNPGAPEFR